MSHQRHNKKSRQSQGRGNPWTDAPRSQQSIPGHVGDGTGHEGVYSNSHVAHAVTTLIGCVVEVNTTSGVVYEGVLRAVSPNMDIVLSVAHDKSKILSRDNVKEVLELKFNSVVNISAKIEPNSSSSTDIFKTDTEISKSNGSSSGREFERFTDFADTPDSLEMENSKGWSVEEMFTVNREKFQVTSNFDEDLSQYTTALNRESDGYTHRAARAKQLANEIEGKIKHGYDDVGTEEELFSAVVRGSEAPALPPTPVTSSQLHTPTQSTTSTHRPHSDTPSMTENSNQPDSVACNQPSPSSTSADLSTSVSKSIIDNVSGDIVVNDAESAKHSDNHSPIVMDTNNSASNVSSEPVTMEASLVKMEESVVVESVSSEIPATGKATPTICATTTSEASSSVEDPRCTEPDSTTDNEPADNKANEFKLNPNAKAFEFNLNAQEFKPPGASFSPVVTAASSTPASPSHTVTTYHPSSRQHRPYKRQQRTVTSTQSLYPTSEYILQSVPQSGGFMIPQGGIVRPGQTHFVGPGNQVLFPSPYQLPSAQPGLINTYAPHLQQVVTTGVSGAPNTHPIMLTPLQHQQLFQQQLQAQQSGLLAAGGQMQQSALLPGVGQGGGLLPGGGAVLPGIGLAAGAHQVQPYQQVIYSQGGQVMYTPQGCVPAGGGATPMGVSAGTMPLHSSVQPQPLISAVNLTQPQVFTPGRISYPSHPPGK